MLCGATRRSNTDPLDRTSPVMPIGPHWMSTWPLMLKQMAFRLLFVTKEPS
jgi:hypothetical protein